MQYKVTATWLSKKPSQQGFLVSAITTFLLAVGSVLYWQDWHGANSWMPVSGDALFKNGEWWRAFSALFAHADAGHLFSNGFLFFILAAFLSGYFGKLVFPVMAFLFGALTNIVVASQMPGEVNLLGVSGVVYWMGGAWLVLYFCLDVKRSLSQRFLRAMGVALAMFFPAEAFKPEISYSSHFVGFILGVLFGVGYYYWNQKKFLAAVHTEIVEEDREEAISLESSDPSPFFEEE